MVNILILGGSGFIALNLAISLRNRGYNVITSNLQNLAAEQSIRCDASIDMTMM